MQYLRLRSWIDWIPSLHLLKKNACMGGCLGGYVRPPPAAALPEQASRPLKRRSNRRARTTQSARSSRADWWMSSSNEMTDNNRSVLNSQALRSFSRSLNECQRTGVNNDNKLPFENHALANWHKQRQEWVGNHKPKAQQSRGPVIRWSATYEELLGTSRPFTEPVPLPEMVDFLVDEWEREGLYG